MARLVVRLHQDRDRCGSLALYDARGRRVCGPFAVAGRSSDSWAAVNGNPERSPLLRFGDTPTGAYKIRRILKSGSRTSYDAAQFGPNGIVVLEGVSGDAALAEANGRFHVLIIGGKRSANGELRSTAGSLRLSDEGQKLLVSALRKLRDVGCEIDEDASVKSTQRVFIDPHCKDEDPQSIDVDRERSASRHTYQDLLLGGAAGAMILEVAFVALPTTPTRAAEMPSFQNLQHMRDDVKFLPPKAQRDPGYVRLAYRSPPANSALDQLNNAQGQPTGTTFDNSRNPQPSDAVPSGTVSVPSATPGAAPVASPSTPTVTAPSPPSTGSSDTDRVIQQQREINAINSQKPPPNATQDQLNQWQQNQQQGIQNIVNPPPPSTPPPPPKTNSVILDKGAPPPPKGGSSQ